MGFLQISHYIFKSLCSRTKLSISASSLAPGTWAGTEVRAEVKMRCEHGRDSRGAGLPLALLASIKLLLLLLLPLSYPDTSVTGFQF